MKEGYGIRSLKAPSPGFGSGERGTEGSSRSQEDGGGALCNLFAVEVR